MISASVLKAMAEAGCTPDQMVAVVEAHERQEEGRQAEKRELARQRQIRRRERIAVSRDVTPVTRDERDTPLDKESTPIPPKEINSPKENPPKGGQKKGPRAVLETVLSEARATALVEHRQRIRKPMTEHAAHLLAKKLADAPQAGFTPDQAADLMIEKGWQSLEIDWLHKSSPPSDSRPAEDEKRWQTRLNFGRREGRWSTAEWGPMPGQPDCRAPPELLDPGDGDGWTEAERERAA